MTEQKIPPAPSWDLESIFPGGSESKEFKIFCDDMKAELSSATTMLKNLPANIDESSLKKALDGKGIKEYYVHIEYSGKAWRVSFLHCSVVLLKACSSGAEASRGGGTAMEGMPVAGRDGRNGAPEMIRAGSAEASFRLDFLLTFSSWKK